MKNKLKFPDKEFLNRDEPQVTDEDIRKEAAERYIIETTDLYDAFRAFIEGATAARDGKIPKQCKE